MKHAVLILVVCSFFISGCTLVEPRMNEREDIDGTRLIGTHGNDGFYRRDLHSEDYNTNQNPNFLELTEDRLDYGDDEDKFGEVITMNSNLEPGRVFITGATARVTAYHDGSLSKEEKSKLKKHLDKQFLKVMPRYDVRLTIKER